MWGTGSKTDLNENALFLPPNTVYFQSRGQTFSGLTGSQGT